MQRLREPLFIPYAVLAAAQIAVGAAAIFARFALSSASPLAVAALRLSIAAGVLWVAAVFWPRPGSAVLRQAQHDKLKAQHDKLEAGSESFGAEREVAQAQHDKLEPQRDKTQAKRDTFILIAAGVALAVHFATWIWSLQYTSVAVSTLLVATTPLWTAIYDSAVLKRHLSATAWGAFLAAAAGLTMVTAYNRTRPPVPGHELLGDALAVAGAIAIGAYFILVREVRDSYDTRSIVTRTYTWAAAALVVAALAARQSPPAFSAGAAWGGIIAMALISQLLGHTALNAALRWFSPSAVAMTTLLEPVTAAVLAFFIFAETLTPLAICGGVLVLAAIGVFLREESATEAAPSG